MVKGWMGFLLVPRGSGEASGRRVEGCLRLSRARGLSAVEATPTARLRSCTKRIIREREYQTRKKRTKERVVTTNQARHLVMRVEEM
jgi:hypothetical protein